MVNEKEFDIIYHSANVKLELENIKKLKEDYIEEIQLQVKKNK